ncbi:MAG: hypothetical protein ACE5IJ_12260, partial [Thermoplasmata archaeon]
QILLCSMQAGRLPPPSGRIGGGRGMNDPYRYVMRLHCPRCGIWFRSRDQYEWHMRRIHKRRRSEGITEEMSEVQS